MSKLSRRTVIRGSLGLAAAGTVARPFVANAAATTASVWWTQGFVPEEDAAFRAMVADYEKQSGNTIDDSIIPFAPLMQKIVSSLTSGDVPDVMEHNTADATVIPQNAWKDKLVDLSDLVQPLKSQFHPAVSLGSRFYNSVTKQRGDYLAPYKNLLRPLDLTESADRLGLRQLASQGRRRMGGTRRSTGVRLFETHVLGRGRSRHPPRRQAFVSCPTRPLAQSP